MKSERESVGTGDKWLLVEPHRQFREVLEETLLEAGLQLSGEAEDGVQAIVQALALRPDFILMDLSLPDMSGVVATRLLRELLPSVKVILLIDEDAPEYREAARESGAYGCVVKTSAREELHAAWR